jgi:hypothetical protein
VEQFIGAFGGAIAIWLGLNFVVFIQFIFDPLVFILRKCFSASEVVHDANSPDEDYARKAFWKKQLIKFVDAGQDENWHLIAIRIIETLFWMVIYVVGGMFTAKSCVELYQQFDSNPTNTNVLISFNKAMTLSPATICLQLQNYYINRFQDYANPNDAMDYSTFLTNYFDGSISKESFLEHNKTWPDMLRLITLHYMVIIDMTEDPVVGIPDAITSTTFQSTLHLVASKCSDSPPANGRFPLYLTT